MKTKLTLLALCVALALVAGCSTTADKDKRCATYADVYTLYLASTEVRPVSKEESAAAAAAAIFLRTYCGWTGKTTTPATKGTRGAKPEPEIDANGVPIIYPPAK